MYSPLVTARHIEAIEARLGLRLHRYTPAQSHELAAYLAEKQAKGQLLDSNGQFARKDYAAFVRNERILCQQDFTYWLRYCQIIRDGSVGGGLGPLNIWESQQILLDLIAKTEERNIEQHERYCYKDVQSCMCDGICVVDNKGGRQLGHTAICRALTWHRETLWPHTRAAAVTTADDKLMKMVEADELIYNSLPFFLKPAEVYHEKGKHYTYDVGSSILYQTSEQKGGGSQTVGIGTGGQFDVSHLTEVSSYRHADMLELDFFPTLPRNPYTLCVMETTPLGRNNWWFTFSEKARKGKVPRWKYLYIPWYAEPKKYRALPPTNWEPSESTLQMAYKVYRTSKEFVGRDVTLGREQLYWWETNYNAALESNTLNLHLSNFSCTPEQGFQFTTLSAIRNDILDWMRTTAMGGVGYELEGL